MNKPAIKGLLFIAFLLTFAWIVLSITKIISSVAPDFRILWTFASHLRPGQNLYLSPDISIPNPYPPLTFLFYLPFTFIPYPQAQAVFIFLIFASLVGLTLLSLHLVIGKFPLLSFIATLTLILFSFPTKFSLGMGQQNSIAYFLLLVSYYFWKKKVSLLSGIFLALSISLKPVLGFVAIFFLIQGAWQTLFWAFVTGFFETISTFLISNTNLLMDWIRQTLVYIPLAGRGVYYNQGFAGFISRLTQNTALVKTSAILFLISILSAVIVAARKTKNTNLDFSLFTISLLLVDTLSWQHHFVWLIFPFVVLAHEVIKKKNTLLSGLIVIAYLLVSWNFKNPDIVPAIFLSTQFYGAMILWVINIYFIFKWRKKRNLYQGKK